MKKSSVVIALLALLTAVSAFSQSQTFTYTMGTAYVTSPDSAVRPATSVTYADGQAIGSKFLVFKGVAPSNKSVVLSDGTAVSDTGATENALFDLLLLKDTVAVTKPSDGVVFSLPAAQKLKVIGVIPITLTRKYGTGAVVTVGTFSPVGLTCTPSNAQGDVYGVLTAAGAWKGNISGKILVMPRFVQ